MSQGKTLVFDAGDDTRKCDLAHVGTIAVGDELAVFGRGDALVVEVQASTLRGYDQFVWVIALDDQVVV